jgi:hypothetical protein
MKITSTTEIEINEDDVLELIKAHVAQLGYQINDLKQDGLNFHIMAEPVSSKGGYKRKEAGNQAPADPFPRPGTGKIV